uniref:Putative secreted protein n=1 Tax=Anopheles marajoara TaxID=58244 RepID=A0A2M4CA86_9DIPT
MFVVLLLLLLLSMVCVSTKREIRDYTIHGKRARSASPSATTTDGGIGKPGRGMREREEAEMIAECARLEPRALGGVYVAWPRHAHTQ